jgi:hypothetical protein
MPWETGIDDLSLRLLAIVLAECVDHPLLGVRQWQVILIAKPPPDAAVGAKAATRHLAA